VSIGEERGGRAKTEEAEDNNETKPWDNLDNLIKRIHEQDIQGVKKLLDVGVNPNLGLNKHICDSPYRSDMEEQHGAHRTAFGRRG
jgi:hypothetical protein